jgi:hypothetical protein
MFSVVADWGLSEFGDYCLMRMAYLAVDSI